MRLWPAALLCLLCAASSAVSAQAERLGQAEQATQAAPTQAVVILSRLPHQQDAFTQGLLHYKGAFYESTGIYGQSSLRRTDPATGRVLARRNLPRRLFGEGLALCPADQHRPDGPQRLLQLTWREGLILAYAAPDLRPLSQHALRGQGWGLACQGTRLALSDGTDTLRFLDAQSLAETGETLRVRDATRPVERLNELEWVNGWLLANIWGEDRIAVIHPASGQVALWLDLAPLRRELAPGAEAANGIAYDANADAGRGALCLTGKRWSTLFTVALPALLRQPPAKASACAASGTDQAGSWAGRAAGPC